MTGPSHDDQHLDPGLAKERTELAWRRTDIAFTALGGALVKMNPAIGLPTLAISTLIWAVNHHATPQLNPRRPLLTTVGILTVSLVALTTVLLGDRITRPHIVFGTDPPRPCGANPADVDLVRVGKVEAAVEAGIDLKCQRPTNPPSAIVTSLTATTPVVFTTPFTVEMNPVGRLPVGRDPARRRCRDAVCFYRERLPSGRRGPTSDRRLRRLPSPSPPPATPRTALRRG